jgi:hypothetical protein
MRNTSLVIILLATIALTLIVPAVSGISLLQQQAMAATNGQNGRPGTNCSAGSGCRVGGSTGGSGNDDNRENSFNGNGGNGGFTDGQCFGICDATGGNGGNDNIHNSGNSLNGNGGSGGKIGAGTELSGCIVPSCNAQEEKDAISPTM